MSNSRIGKPKKKIVSLISYCLFGLLSTLIIAESCVPSGASGKQSQGLSEILAGIVNTLFPPKPLVNSLPSSISASTSAAEAEIDGVKTKLFGDDEAIIGTTKLYTYKLSYAETKADTYDYSVSFKTIASPGENSYTYTLNTSKSGGTLRLIPLLEGDYHFTLTDADNHVADIRFKANPRIAPKDILFDDGAFEVGLNETKRAPFAMSFGSLNRDDGSVDHYLARYWSREEAVFTSSNESVFTVSEGGLITGKAEGEADLLWHGKTVKSIHVVPSSLPSIASMSLSIEEDKEAEVSPLDYDYSYGKQIKVRYFNATHDEVFPSFDPVSFSSSDPLTAFVDNDHLEVKDDTLSFVKGGYVSGYREKGNATITASLLSNPEIQASLVFESKPVSAESVTIKAMSGGKEVDENTNLVAGSTITFSASFLPENAEDRSLHVSVDDPSKLNVLNNDTNSPTVQILVGGSHSFKVYANVLGEASAKTVSLSATDKPVIDQKDMPEFTSFIRKAAGHFFLFLITGVFESFALCSSILEKEKGHYIVIGFACTITGFVLAGLSELIQAIPSLGRGSTWSDVGIDTLGFFVGAMLTMTIFGIIAAIRNKKEAH